MIDMKIPAMGRLLVPALAVLAMAWFTACTSATGAGTTTTGRSRGQDASALARGERQFKVSCSGCHGADARGNGPIAPLLQVPVPDLTLIASRRGGTFPEEEIYQVVDGQAVLAAHGPRHMPVWGYEFFGDDPDDEVAHRQATEKVDGVVRFLRSIQRTK